MATLKDIKTLLKNRVGFRKPIDESFEALDADNNLTDSGLHFQDAHSIVSIKNIKDSQPITNITDAKLNETLTLLRESNVLEVLTDVFKGQSIIDEVLINSNLAVFDKAIYLRMVLKVGEMVLSSPRINSNTHRLNETVLGKLRLDLNGSNDSSYKNPNVPYHLGYTSRYRKEIEILIATFNNSQSDMLEVVTLR